MVQRAELSPARLIADGKFILADQSLVTCAPDLCADLRSHYDRPRSRFGADPLAPLGKRSDSHHGKGGLVRKDLERQSPVKEETATGGARGGRSTGHGRLQHQLTELAGIDAPHRLLSGRRTQTDPYPRKLFRGRSSEGEDTRGERREPPAYHRAAATHRTLGPKG